eukprot:13368880-Ditylum_brightwellii.AAC.1
MQAEKKGNRVSTEKDFYTWDRHTKTHNHWMVQDDKTRSMPYARAHTQPSINSITVTKWESISDADNI